MNKYEKMSKTFVVSERAKAFAYCLFSMAVAHVVVSASLPLWITALAYGNEVVAIYKAIIRL